MPLGWAGLPFRISKESFSIGLLLNQDYSLLNNDCFNRFLKLKGLVVTKNKIMEVEGPRLIEFNINREMDIKSLLTIAKKSGDVRAIIIDDSTTKDKDVQR